MSDKVRSPAQRRPMTLSGLFHGDTIDIKFDLLIPLATKITLAKKKERQINKLKIRPYHCDDKSSSIEKGRII